MCRLKKKRTIEIDTCLTSIVLLHLIRQSESERKLFATCKFSMATVYFYYFFICGIANAKDVHMRNVK